MRVRIKERLRPFSHEPGASCLVPGTEVVIRAFPTQLEVMGKVFPLPHSGPVKNFTLLQDLETGVVKVFGHAPEGYFCYKVYAGEGEILVGPWRLAADVAPFVRPKERLFLGSTKTLDWTMTGRRADPREIFPVWYALAQATPAASNAPLEGDLMPLFGAGFSGILVPEKEDRCHLGVVKEVPPALVTRGGTAIRSLFVENNHLLPRLPKAFRSGRMTGVQVGDVRVDFSWSKGFLREVVLRGQGSFTLKTQQELKAFRARKSQRDRGFRAAPGDPLRVDGLLLLDNFTK